MQLKKGQVEEINIDSVAFGGQGIGEFEGIKVFVDGAMPGDCVDASFRKIKKKYIEADLVEIKRPSGDRLEARCEHYDRCGGCQMQHIPYDQQLEMKKSHTVDCFERIGEIASVPVTDVIPCDEQFWYRNKMEFSFGYDHDMSFSLGFHVPKRRYDILDINKCYLQSPFSNQILKLVRDFAFEMSWMPFRYQSGEGTLRSLFVREGKRTGEVMVNLVVAESRPDDFEEKIKILSERLMGLKGEDKKVVSFYYSWSVSRRGERKKFFKELVDGKAAINEEMVLENGDKLEFEILPDAFFQVNTFQAEKLYSQVVKLISDREHEVIFDLFCGTGTIGLFLSRYAEHVVGVEMNSDAVESAIKNAKKNKIFNIDFYTGDVNKMIGNVRLRPSMIVVDPPRCGLAKKIIPVISDFGCSRIVYVSCNPATLARDCAYLGEFGYKVVSVQPVDMFPNTYHIENVCLLER